MPTYQDLLARIIAGAMVAATLYYPLAWLTGEARYSAGLAAGASGLIVSAVRRRRG